MANVKASTETQDIIILSLFVGMGIIITCAVLYSLHNAPYVKYKLSSGEIVECRSKQEQESTTLKNCKGGLEYLTQTNVTMIGESKP